MERARELLLAKAELLLWQCRKEMYAGKVAELRKQYTIEQDEAERAERSFFAKLRRNYEENLGKEKAEVIKVRLELERIEKIIAEAEEKIPLLERKMENDSFLYNIEDFTEEEKELRNWCQWMEEAYAVIALANRCIEEGREARLAAYSGPGDREKNLLFQNNINLLMEKIESLLMVIGRVRYLPGMRMKTIYGTRRNLLMNGRTLCFFWKDHAVAEIDILDFDLSELYGSWAVGETVERKQKELDEIYALLCMILEEKISCGNDLLLKTKRSYQLTGKRDIFGFEIQK